MITSQPWLRGLANILPVSKLSGEAFEGCIERVPGLIYRLTLPRPEGAWRWSERWLHSYALTLGHWNSDSLNRSAA